MKTYNEVHSFLLKCDIPIIRYIELQLAFAKDVRTYQLKYTVSDEEFAKEFGGDINLVKILQRGATAISLIDMAKLNTLYAARISAERAALKVGK